MTFCYYFSVFVILLFFADWWLCGCSNNWLHYGFAWSCSQTHLRLLVKLHVPSWVCHLCLACYQMTTYPVLSFTTNATNTAVWVVNVHVWENHLHVKLICVFDNFTTSTVPCTGHQTTIAWHRARKPSASKVCTQRYPWVSQASKPQSIFWSLP